MNEIFLYADTSALDRVLHRIDVEHAGPRRNDDHGRIADRIVDDSGGVRRRVDENPFVAGAPGRRDNLADRAACGLERRLVGAAQLVPERQRPLRITVDEKTGLRRLMDVCGKMSRQGALARASFA